MEVAGTILTGRTFDPIEGRVIVEDGRIEAIEETAVDSGAIVLPAFVNAHTHIGDSFAKDAGADLTLEELVAPPDGLKHRLLRTVDTERQIDRMRASMRSMAASGTATFIDFREGGTEGVAAIQRAASDLDLEAVVLGRDDPAVIEQSDGFGASGAADGEFGAERQRTREAGQLFGIHAGEHDPADINPALDLNPDFLVHTVTARDVHLERIEDSEIPVVVCPRSNLVTDVGLPPIPALLERTTVALGTDNVMLASPSMFREMAVLASHTDLSPATILGMATWAGGVVLDRHLGVIEPGAEAKLLVLDGESDTLIDSRDIVRSIVTRAGPTDVRGRYW